MPLRDDAAGVADKEARRLRKDVERLDRHLEAVSKQCSAQSKGLQMLVNHVAALDKRVSELTRPDSSPPSG